VAVTQTSALLRHIRRLGQSEVALTDRQLLERFIVEDDEAAFAELVGRHGALVLNVCRRTLWREQDAEDAFQAISPQEVQRLLDAACPGELSGNH
jgi:hypothetical protein